MEFLNFSERGLIQELLEKLFEPSDFWLLLCRYERFHKIERELPPHETSSKVRWFSAVVRTLMQHGYIDKLFFEFLEKERPYCSRDIREYLREWSARGSNNLSRHIAIIAEEHGEMSIDALLDSLLAKRAVIEIGSYNFVMQQRESTNNHVLRIDEPRHSITILKSVDGEKSAVDGRYVGGWPQLAARNANLGRPVAVFSKNTSEYLLNVSDPIDFFTMGERNFVEQFSAEFQTSQVDILCTYRMSELTLLANRRKNISLAELIAHITASHDAVYAYREDASEPIVVGRRRR